MFNPDATGVMETSNDVLPSHHSLGLVIAHIFTNRLSQTELLLFFAFLALVVLHVFLGLSKAVKAFRTAASETPIDSLNTAVPDYFTALRA